METVCPALKLTQKCYLHINIFYKNINIFFLKTANLIINWLLFDATCHLTERPPSPFDQIWREGGKNLNFQTFQWIGDILEMQSMLFKNPDFPSLFMNREKLGKIHSPRPESMYELGKLMSWFKLHCWKQDGEFT